MELKNKSENLKIKNYEFNNTNKNFISVGRFSISGHAKRQDFILNAFSEAQNLLNSDFNLFLVGSLDYSNQEDLRFFDDLKSKKVKNVHIFENLEFEKLQELCLYQDFMSRLQE